MNCSPAESCRFTRLRPKRRREPTDSRVEKVSGFRVAGSSGVGRANRARPLSGRYLRAMLLSFCLGIANGCYSYVPVASTPAPGSVLSLQLNDSGRVALGKTLGPTVDKLEGAVESASDSAYTLKMQSVTFFNGQTSDWTGESVSVGK